MPKFKIVKRHKVIPALYFVGRDTGSLFVKSPLYEGHYVVIVGYDVYAGREGEVVHAGLGGGVTPIPPGTIIELTA